MTAPSEPGARLRGDLAAVLDGVRSVGVVTGAGISQESGIPTYRGVGGVYDDPEEGDRVIEALSGATFRRDPWRTWSVLRRLVEHAVAARPNAAHAALVSIERAVGRFVLLTQNVDGLHAEAGSANVVEIHGNARRTRCTACGAASPLDVAGLARLSAPPACGSCGGLLRPDVVLFGERLPLRAVEALERELLAAPPDLVLVVGTSGLFPYVLEPARAARAAGRRVVEINPEPSAATPLADVVLRLPATRGVPAVAAALAGPAG